MSETVPGLNREVDRLLHRLRGWSPSAWSVATATGASRASRTAALAGELARLGRSAGSGAPPTATPPPLAPHGLADQITVLADDLLRLLGDVAPARRAALVAEAHGVVTAARLDLEGPGFGFTAARP
jgi:hypothetical protein